MGLGKVFQRLFTPMADIRNALEGGGGGSGKKSEKVISGGGIFQNEIIFLPFLSISPKSKKIIALDL